MGLITRERLNNRRFMVETTPYFADYFGFGQSPLKTKIQLRQMFSTMKIHKMDNGERSEESSEVMESAFTEGPLIDSLDGLP